MCHLASHLVPKYWTPEEPPQQLGVWKDIVSNSQGRDSCVCSHVMHLIIIQILHNWAIKEFLR